MRRKLLLSKSKWHTTHEKNNSRFLSHSGTLPMRREEKRRKLLFSKSKWQPPMGTKLAKLLFPTCQNCTTQNEN
jgi:hypothetical protein